MYKIGQNVIDFGGDKNRYGYVRSIGTQTMTVDFNDNGDVCIIDLDDEFVMSVEDWNRAGRELRADERVERLAFGGDY